MKRRRSRRRAAVVLALGAWVSACTISRRVEPVPANTSPTPLCIKENDTVWSKEFLPMLRQKLSERGIRTSVFDGTLPSHCRYHLVYTANWRWDLAVYLEYAELRIYDRQVEIGQAIYNARDGGARMDKFGTTFGKLDPMLDELLRTPSAAASGS